MIQPGMTLVFANDCGAKRASGHMCEGCRCCDVSSPERKCSCCGGGENAVGEKNCCLDDTESDETLELKVIVVSTIEPASVDGSESRVSESQPSEAVSSSCGCGVESPPLSESAPLRPTVPPRESVAIRYSGLADLFGASMLPRPTRCDVGEVLPSPHFSQVQLCIWRL